MRQELLEAVDELRLRPTSRAWFFPVLLDECEVPDLSIGASETLRDLQHTDLRTEWDQRVAVLARALKNAVCSQDDR